MHSAALTVVAVALVVPAASMQIPELDPTIPAHRLKAFIQQHLGGKCKILSEGSMCACPLCDLDRLYDALRWYEEETVAISNNVKLQRDQAVLASVQVLVLDAGKHSTDVIGKQQGEQQ